jgi:hypothetical protein
MKKSHSEIRGAKDFLDAHIFMISMEGEPLTGNYFSGRTFDLGSRRTGLDCSHANRSSVLLQTCISIPNILAEVILLRCMLSRAFAATTAQRWESPFSLSDASHWNR